MDLLLIILVIFLIFGGGFGYSRWGYQGGIGIGGILLIVLVIIWCSDAEDCDALGGRDDHRDPRHHDAVLVVFEYSADAAGCALQLGGQLARLYCRSADRALSLPASAARMTERPLPLELLLDICPKCGAETEQGFGLAGGGYGLYVFCPTEGCDYFAKLPVED